MRNRSTGELMVLMIAGTVCFAILVSIITIVIVTFVNPDFDNGEAARQISDLLNTLVGLLAGYLAGKTETVVRKLPPPEE